MKELRSNPFPLFRYPLIYKTLRVDASFTSREAVRFIAETVNVTSLLVGSEGLYIPDQKRWLDDDAILSDCPDLQEAVCSEATCDMRGEKGEEWVTLF